MVTFTISKPKFLPTRHIPSLVLLLGLSVVWLYNYPHHNPFRHFNDFNIHSILPGPPFIINKTNPLSSKTSPWPTPPSLRNEISFVRGSTEGNMLANRSWTRPIVITSYARPLDSNNSWTELFLFVAGVRMGNVHRKISVVGCFVGHDVYQARDVNGEVFVCVVHRKVSIGEAVSLVLRKDAALTRAMDGENFAGLEIKILQEDLQELPNTTRIRISDNKPSDFIMIFSNATITQVSPPLRQLRQTPRYKVCMGTQMKTFPHLLADWVSYHRKLGVDMIYILDNDAPNELQPYAGNISGVETLYWPFQKSQTQAMSYLLISLRERCEWVLLSDADEYVLIGLDDTGNSGDIRDYVDGIDKSIEQSYLPYLTMGASGHVEIPKGPVPEEYLYKHIRQKHNGKVLARSDSAWLSSRIHVNKGRTSKVVPRTKVVNDEPRVGDEAVLVHFQKRSFEEILMKRDTGSGSLRDKQIGEGKGKKHRSPTNFHRKVDERLRYTYFRDVWRVVGQVEERQVLVREMDGRRYSMEVGV